MDRALLIVGNGLSINLYEHLGLTIHPSYPFSFNVPSAPGSRRRLLDELPCLSEMLASNPEVEDYAIIHDFVQHYRRDNKQDELRHAELRQYLSLAYSHASILLLGQWRTSWRWGAWLRNHCSRLAGVVSFNYDLVPEIALNRAALSFHRLGTPEEDVPNGIPVFKPHGSCDFDMGEGFVGGYTPFKAIGILNNRIINGRGRVSVVPSHRLSQARFEADIVLPFEESQQTRLLWVQQGYKTVFRIAQTVDALIVLGLSYHPCDRPEIDSLISQVPPGAEAWLVNPTPNETFENMVKRVTDKVMRVTPHDFLRMRL